MKLSLKKCTHCDCKIEIIAVLENNVEKSMCPSGKGFLKKLVERNVFKGAFNEIYIHTVDLEDSFKYKIFVGLGNEDELTGEKIRVMASRAISKALTLKEDTVNFIINNVEHITLEDNIKATLEGAALTLYKFDKYMTSKKECDIKEISVSGICEENIGLAEEAVIEAEALIEAIYVSRDLTNEPANVIYPETLGEKVKELGKINGFEVEVIGKDDIKKLGMDAFLAVAQGATNEPKLIVMRYFGDEDNKDNILGLVGKGLTYDSGGYSLKNASGMMTMKGDMAGASTVIGAIAAIAKMKVKRNVVAIVAACENLISKDAFKPGDVINSMGGKTIEVLNTDAEGRLTLVDAVYYAINKEKVSEVLDIATLTGAAYGAFGKVTCAVLTNNDEFYGKLTSSAKVSEEKFWLLPSFDEYKEDIKSTIADLKNIGNGGAGTITAGLFIGEFVENTPWLHLDIATTGFMDSTKDYVTKGGSGFGVRTLYYLAKNGK